MSKKVGLCEHPVYILIYLWFLGEKKPSSLFLYNFKERNKSPQFAEDTVLYFFSFFVAGIVTAMNICVLTMSSKSFSPSLLQG